MATRRQHRPDCRHCARIRGLVAEYRAWRAAYEAAEEFETCGYETERAEYRESHNVPTYKQFLVATAA